MRAPLSRTATSLLSIALAGLVLAACSSTTSHPAAAASTKPPKGPRVLVGTFELTSGHCTTATAAPSGSYFDMLGKNGAGFLANPSGGCADTDYTPLVAGTDGGLETGVFQPNPATAFDASGNALADSIIEPVSFFGTKFSVATQSPDPQTGVQVPAPKVIDTAGALSGNLSAWDAAYNHTYFNQGSPKPNGQYTGLTKPVSGTIACSGAFTLTWQSQIVGGPFNDFTGHWILSGTFKPAKGTLASALGCS